MCVPLKARGRILGVINLASAESGRRFDDQSVSLAIDLATRAAMAVENATLYREAQRTSAELKAVLVQMGDAVIVADASGKVTFANESANRMFGRITIGAAVEGSRPEAELLTLDGDHLATKDMVLVRAVAGEEVSHFIWRVRRGGEDLILDTSAVPLRNEDGSSLGAVTVSRDITVQFDLERQKDSFLIAASHDLKTPLTLIKGTAQLLEQQMWNRDRSDESIISGLSRISATATRMARMVEEMLDVTRLQMGRPLTLDPVSLDLTALIDRIVEEVRTSSERNPILLDLEAGALIGVWDPLRTERVILNLLDNRGKFSAADQPIRIKLTRQEDSEGSWAIISVIDEGVGIPAADLPHVFEQFRRGQNVTGITVGSGLGLAGVKQIIEQHGGTIRVASAENQGVTFTVRLPLEPRQVSMASVKPSMVTA